jgi:hypothetical protein
VQGSHAITAGVEVIDNATFDVAAAGSLTLSGGLSNTAGSKLTKSGGGTLTIGGTQTHGAGAIVEALGGTTNIASSGGTNLAVNAAATVSFSSSQLLAALTIFPGVRVTLTPGGAKTLSLATLSDNGTLDLGDNDLIIRNGGPSGRATIEGKIQSGYAHSTWLGPGVVTSQGDAASGLTTLGVALASDVLGISGGQTETWNGQSVGPSDVLVMYTYAGDANLDGVIDGGDYGAIDNHVQITGASGYCNGDFNYDGVIDGGDYGIIDNNIEAQGAPLGTSASAAAMALAVPEPSCSTLAALAGICLYRRRRKH